MYCIVYTDASGHEKKPGWTGMDSSHWATTASSATIHPILDFACSISTEQLYENQRHR